jgi:delta-1-pyrroline-5-carboxylate synthetase
MSIQENHQRNIANSNGNTQQQMRFSSLQEDQHPETPSRDVHHPWLHRLHNGGNGRSYDDSITRRDMPNMKLIVIKVGTSVLTQEDGTIALGRVGNLVEQVSQLMKGGRKVILVSSGSVWIGKRLLLQRRLLSAPLMSHMDPTTTNEFGQKLSYSRAVENRRACAAAGQSGLMSLYETLFAQKNISCSQVLLTNGDFDSYDRTNSVKKTLMSLLDLGIVPILNENDVVSHKAKHNFSNNDKLASLVASLLQVDLLCMVSDVPGLYTCPPTPSNPEPEVIHTYDPIHIDVNLFSNNNKAQVSKGGMSAKLDSCLFAVNNGVAAAVIVSGFKQHALTRVLAGETEGTLIVKHPSHESLIDNEPAQKPQAMAKKARECSLRFMNESTEFRRRILLSIANALIERQEEILSANEKDLMEARHNNISAALQDRLKLSEAKLKTLATGIIQLANAEDPIGNVLHRCKIVEGLILQKITVPIGVLLVIFESRPDVLPQVVSLAIKSGNGLLLKGGKEATHSNRVLFSIISDCLGEKYSGLISLVESRKQISDLLSLHGDIDLIIPRGSGQLVSYIQENTKIPVMGHAEGICHVYVDKDADLEKAKKIVIDAKCNYPSACNAAETVLIHKDFAHVAELLDTMEDADIKLHAGPSALKRFRLPETKSFHIEYSSNECTVEFVENVDHAIQHINKYGSGHTDAIVSESKNACETFLANVDSACVFSNCSTRFADGYRFGLGCEVGISTGRIHARGPVGIDGLMTSKWKLRSELGHTVTEFSDGTYSYVHETLPVKD